MKRKVGLVGRREGEWIHVGGIDPLYLKAQVEPSVIVRIDLRMADNEEVCIYCVGPGLHGLIPAMWAKLSISDGPHIDALCLLQGGTLAVSST